MFTKKQIDVFFDFSFTDIANTLAYWEAQKQGGSKSAEGHIKALLETRNFLELSRKNIVKVGRNSYKLMVSADHPDNSYIHGSIELVKNILAFGAIMFVTTKQPTDDSENISAGSTELAHQVKESVPDSDISIDGDSAKLDSVSSELRAGD